MMNVVKNYSYNLLYQITALLVPFVTIPYISRIFGADGIGVYAVSYAVAQYFCLFGILGLNTYGTREIAYVKDDDENCRKAFWNLNYMKFITMGFAIVLYVLYVLLCVDNKNVIVYLCQGFVLLASLFDISWYYYGKEDFKLTAIRNISVKIIGMIMVFLLVHDKNDIWLYTLILASTLFFGQIVMWSKALQKMKLVCPNKELIISYVKNTIKLWLPAVAINIYTSLDKVMLGTLVNDYQVGLYENSQHMIKMVSSVTTTLAIVMTPRMSNLFARKEYEKLQLGVYKSFRAVSLIAFPMFLGIIAIRNSFVMWYFGPGFEEVSSLLAISALLVITLSWSNIVGNQVLISCGNEDKYTIAVVVGAIVNVILNIILIPLLQCMGAIISSITAEYIGMFLMLFFSKKYICIKKLLFGLKTYLLASIIMFFPINYLGEIMDNTPLTTIIQILIAFLIYSFVIVIMKDSFIFEIVLPQINRIFNNNKI